MTDGDTLDVRRQEIAEAMSVVQRRIAGAATAAGRSPGDVTLVVVTKRFPVQDVRHVMSCGARHVGENVVAEASAKHAELAASGEARNVTWHAIGQVQSNKAAKVAEFADLVHSVDRLSLVKALSRGADRAGRTVECLVQLSVDGDPKRGGCPLAEVDALAERLSGAPGLALRGVMAVAPLGMDPDVAFADVRGSFDRLAAQYDGVRHLSTGMSGDFERAISHGATLVRVGAAILGSRPDVG